MQTGKVKWFNETKGYGFITPDDGSEDVFCHVSQISHHDRPLNEGDQVSFEIVAGRKGPAAENITKI